MASTAGRHPHRIGEEVRIRTGVVVSVPVVGVLVVGVLVVGVLVVGVLVVATLAEFDCAHRTDGLERRNPLIGRRVDHVEQALLELSAVHDQRVGGVDRKNFLCGCLEVVRVGTDRHDRDDLGRFTHDGIDDVAEHIGGHRNGRQLPVSRCYVDLLDGGPFVARPLSLIDRTVDAVTRLAVGGVTRVGSARCQCKAECRGHGDERGGVSCAHVGCLLEVRELGGENRF